MKTFLTLFFVLIIAGGCFAQSGQTTKTVKLELKPSSNNIKKEVKNDSKINSEKKNGTKNPATMSKKELEDISISKKNILTPTNTSKIVEKLEPKRQ